MKNKMYIIDPNCSFDWCEEVSAQRAYNSFIYAFCESVETFSNISSNLLQTASVAGVILSEDEERMRMKMNSKWKLLMLKTENCKKQTILFN